jgi:hypothetical protein
MNTPKKSLTEVLSELSEIQEVSIQSYRDEAKDFWNNLSMDDQLLAFYSVCSKLHEAAMEGRSYRGTLYDVFGFGMESYGVGMDAGFLDIHNWVYTGVESCKRG